MYVLRTLSTGLCVKRIEKFHIFNGGWRNGKGFISAMMIRMLKDYACKLPMTVLIEDPRKHASGAPNPALAQLHLMRYVVCAELPGDPTLDQDSHRRGCYLSPYVTIQRVQCKFKPHLGG